MIYEWRSSSAIGGSSVVEVTGAIPVARIKKQAVDIGTEGYGFAAQTIRDPAVALQQSDRGGY
jgi:hypothetical protein